MRLLFVAGRERPYMRIPFCAALIKFTPALHRLLTINIAARRLRSPDPGIEHLSLKGPEYNLLSRRTPSTLA